MAAQTEDKKLDGAGLSVLWGLIKNIIPTVPTNVSSFTNDAAYVSQLETHNQNLVLASPNGASGLPSFRALAASDIPDLSGTYLTSASLNGYATQSWVTSQGFGTVSSIKVGTTSYSPSSGVVSLPAYPTTLPASDVYSWAKQSTKPSYSWSEIGSRPTKLSEFTNDSGFITGITSSMVTTALGFTPANSTSLSSYLPLRGGTISSSYSPIVTFKYTAGAGVWTDYKANNQDAIRYIVGVSAAYYYTIFHNDNGTQTNRFCISPEGNVGIGWTTPTFLLQVGGTIRCSGLNFSHDNGVECDEYGNIKHKSTSSTSYWNVATKSGSIALAVVNNGRVGIGTQSPNNKLSVYGDTEIHGGQGQSLRFTSTDNKYHAIRFNDSNGDTAGIFHAFYKSWQTGNALNLSSDKILLGSWGEPSMVINQKDNKNVGVGTSSPSYLLHVAGSVGATAFTNTSDIRNKDFISDTSMSIEQIANAPSFLFKWKTGDDRNVHAGSSAQYWNMVLPETVSAAQDEQHTLSMQYDVIALLSSIAIAKEVVNDKERIKQLEQRVSQLEAQLAN